MDVKKRRVNKTPEIGLKKELFILMLIGLLISLFFIIKPTYLGYVIYQPNTYNWTFDNPQDYIFDSSLININNGEVKLTPQINATFWNTTNEIGYIVEQAIYDNKDDTDKIITLNDNKRIKVNKEEIFNVNFSGYLDNGDKINLYLTNDPSTEATNIYLCDINTICNYPGYGSVYFDNTENWYTIAITGLESPKSAFNIDPAKVNFDYINATHIEIIENNSTEINYPQSAVIETNDISISANSILFNNEYINNIIYYYSIDSGSVWLDIPSNKNISLVNATNIRFRANLTSDTLTTPVLYDMSISYLSEICEESWSCTEWSECSQDTKLTTRNCNDINSCGTIANKPLESLGCFPDYYEINNSQLISVEANKITKINNTNIILDILTNENISDANISVLLYENHGSNLPSKSLKFVDINANPNLIQSLNSTSIKIYYTDREISSLNLKEDSLKIYYYNETSLIWEALDSTVNSEENYIEVNLTHFSTYGIFGEETSTNADNAPPISSGGGSSGGSSSRTTQTQLKQDIEKQQEVIAENKNEQTIPIKPEEPKENIIEEKKQENNIITGEVIKEAERNDLRMVITGIILLAIIILFAFMKIKSSQK